MVFAHLTIGVGVIGVVFSIGDADLRVRIDNFTIGHDFKILINLAIALVGVHDYVEVFVASEHLGDDAAKRFLQHAYHSGFIDVFQLFKFRKTVHHINWFLFLCHNFI